MKADNRPIKDWLSDVRRGIVRLPEFQRHEVWDPTRVAGFLTAVILNRPLGVFLELEIDPGDKPFKIRNLPGAPESDEGSCLKNLLDGQQRLIALWKSLSGKYEKHFYVQFQKGEKNYEPIGVISISENGKQKRIIGNPILEFEANCVPVKILGPDSERDAIKWRKNVEKEVTEMDGNYEKLESMINRLRESFSNEFIPTLTLPKGTKPGDAIDVFIQINRSASILTHFDLAVAQMQRTGESLHKLVRDVRDEVPKLVEIEGASNEEGTQTKAHSRVGDLILKVACLLQEKKPTFGNYQQLNFDSLFKSRDKLIKGFKWSLKILEGIGIGPSSRLPTTVPIRVLPGLHQFLPDQAPLQARAHENVTKYLWWAFLSDRYDRQANDRLKEDYDGLAKLIEGQDSVISVPAFDAEKPEIEDLVEAGWPKRNRLGAALLLAFSQDGALDLSNLRQKLLLDPKAEYHHIFPRKILKDKNLPHDRALNAMLLASPVNAEWLTRFPGDYLALWIEDAGPSIPQKDIERALESHMLSLQDLLEIREGSKKRLKSMYENFLAKRASSVHGRVKELLD